MISGTKTPRFYSILQNRLARSFREEAVRKPTSTVPDDVRSTASDLLPASAVCAVLPALGAVQFSVSYRECGISYSALSMSALGHVWTAPWQELSDVAAALVGCGHVSGLLMRQVWPLALMLCADRVPIENTHLEVR
jgi:hypothetical protein